MNILKKRVASLLLLPLALILATGQVSAAKAANTGSVTGTVKISVDGAAATPLVNVPVAIGDVNYVGYGIGAPVATVNTSGAGDYSFSNLADGTYYVIVGQPFSSKASSESPLLQADGGVWYSSMTFAANYWGTSAGLYASVSVSNGASVVATDLTLKGFATVGHITGSVLDGNGQPVVPDNSISFGGSNDLAEVKAGVVVSDEAGEPLFDQYSDLTGHFDFYVPAGTYSLSYGDPYGYNPVFENGVTDPDLAPTLDLTAGGLSANHNFVINSFDLTKVGSSSAKISGQLKAGTDIKINGVKVPTGASATYSWNCATVQNGQSGFLGQGAVLHVAIDAAASCPSGKIVVSVTLSKASYIDANFTVTDKVKVTSTSKLKYAASSTKLINKFASISGTGGLGSVLRGENANFKLKSVSKTATSWFRCPTQAAAQNPKLVGCQQIVSANNHRTYKITAYDSRSFLVYRVQVMKYSDSKQRGTIAPADSLPFAAGYF